MILSRLLAPTVTVRLFDPMPLPRKSAAVRRARIVLKRSAIAENKADSVSKAATKSRFPKFTYKVRRVPLLA